jgi:hypothetical protein
VTSADSLPVIVSGSPCAGRKPTSVFLRQLVWSSPLNLFACLCLPASGQTTGWTWMSGDRSGLAGLVGVYEITPDLPPGSGYGGRVNALAETTSTSYAPGSYGKGSNGTAGCPKDLWKYQPSNLNVGLSSTSFTLASGGQKGITITITPHNGFSSAVTCSGLPTGASCSFNPTTGTPPGSTSTTLMYRAQTLLAAMRPNSRPFLPGTVLALCISLLGWRKRRGLPMLLLLVVTAAGLGLISGCGRGVSGGSGGGGGGSSTTLIQHATRFNCTTASCAVTTSSTAAGSLLVLYSSAQYAGTGVASVAALTGVTDNGTSETWTHCPNSMVNDGDNTNGQIHATDCYYILSAAGGATTVTASWTFSGLTSPTYKVDAELYEYSHTGSIYYDTGNAILTSAGCTTCTGPAGLLSGSDDVVIQSAYVNWANRSVSSVSSPYSTVLDTDTSANALYAGFAGANAQASYSQPTWTLSGTAGEASMYSFAAFGSTASPARTGNMLVDFSGCINGSAPTTTCVGNSTFTGWQVTQDGLDGTRPGMTTCTSVIGTNMPGTTTINGVAKTGGSTLDLCGVTSTSGENIGFYAIDLGVSELEAQYNPLTLGFSFRSDCPANQDCGAIGIRLTNGDASPFYATAHASPLGDGKWCLESSNGGGCQESGTPFAYAPNTNYRINLQMAGISGTVDKMTVCQDGPGGSVLGAITATSAATSHGVRGVHIGITGEEPTTAGYHYYWRNIVVGGTYSTTGCF